MSIHTPKDAEVVTVMRVIISRTPDGWHYEVSRVAGSTPGSTDAIHGGIASCETEGDAWDAAIEALGHIGRGVRKVPLQAIGVDAQQVELEL